MSDEAVTRKEVIEATDEQLTEMASADAPVEVVQPTEESVEQPEVKAEEVEPKSDEFVFDKAKYEGIDEGALAAIEKLEKQNFHQKNQINKQSQEVGNTRKQIAEMASEKTELEGKLKEIAERKESATTDEDYKKVLKEEGQIETQLEKVNNSQDALLFESQVLSQYPETDSLIQNEVEAVIKRDFAHLPEHVQVQAISTFKSGEWKNDQDHNAVLTILDRAKALKTQRSYEKQIEDLKSSGNVDNIASNIERVANQTVLPTNGQHNKSKTYTKSELMSMTDSELAEFNQLAA